VVQERILAWMKACELRIALVKNDDMFAPVVMEPLFCCRKLFFFIHLAFVKLEDLLTNDQSLLRISIAFWLVWRTRVDWNFSRLVRC
jgi:hypothetical protein